MTTTVEKVKLSEIHELEDNPRWISKDEFEGLKKSIKDFPEMMEVREIVVDETGAILGGNQRYKALLANGETETTIKRVTGWTDKMKREFVIKDNHANGEWDTEILANNYDPEDLKEWMGDEFPNDWAEEEKEIVEDEVPEPPEEPKAKLGDIYQLGSHRLMCGDSTKLEDVEKLMDGQKADLWLTDPPYNVNIGQGGGSVCSMRIQHHRVDGAIIKNDNFDNDDDFLDFLTKAYAAANANLKPGGAFYIWHAYTKTNEFMLAGKRNNLEIRQVLVWVKDKLVMGRQDYQWKHEPCLYGWKEGAGHYFTNDRTLTTVIDDRKDVDKMTKGELLAMVKTMLNKGVKTTVLDCERPTTSEEHPTMKPVKLIAEQVRNSSQIGESVLDTFGGSGTTLMACEQLGRKCYMMELDPHYVDVIIQRWENFTGEKAVKL